MGTPECFSLTSLISIWIPQEAVMGRSSNGCLVAIEAVVGMPGSVITIANMDILDLCLWWTIAPGNLDGKDIDLVSDFEGIRKLEPVIYC